MAGLSVKLPISQDPDDGISLNKSFKEMVRQNLIMLLLTSKGERCMILDFGVGIKQYLFETDSASLRSALSSNIRSQINKYLPYINLVNLTFQSSYENINIDPNSLSITIEYIIVPLGEVDVLSVAVNDNDLITF